jgi:riboflavin transporter FmnP
MLIILKDLRFNKKGNKDSDYFNEYAKYLIASFTALILTTVIMTTLNGLIVTPLYWKEFKIVRSSDLTTVINKYESDKSLQLLLFGIRGYWKGIFALYTSFNLIKFGISWFFLIILYRVAYFNNYKKK